MSGAPTGWASRNRALGCGANSFLSVGAIEDVAAHSEGGGTSVNYTDGCGMPVASGTVSG